MLVAIVGKELVSTGLVNVNLVEGLGSHYARRIRPREIVRVVRGSLRK